MRTGVQYFRSSSVWCLTTGPWLWFPPEGVELVASEPQEVATKDVVGTQQGGGEPLGGAAFDSSWVTFSKVSGLESWARHSCDVCRQTAIIDRQPRSINQVLPSVPTLLLDEPRADLVNLFRLFPRRITTHNHEHFLDIVIDPTSFVYIYDTHCRRKATVAMIIAHAYKMRGFGIDRRQRADTN